MNCEHEPLSLICISVCVHQRTMLMDFNGAFNWRGIADTFNKAAYQKDILLELDPELERKSKDSNYPLLSTSNPRL